jgi:hypothetical protein
VQRLIVNLILAVIILFPVSGVTGRSENPGDVKAIAQRLLPKTVSGWTDGVKDRSYTRDTLFQYMDGGAEVYLAYDFQSLLVREYVRASAPTIFAEVYQMSASREAYGIFSHDPNGEDLEMGQDGLYGTGLLRFWKDRFFVRVLADRESKETRQAILSLGKGVTEGIPRTGERPYLLRCLPPTGLLRGPVPYFHKQISLDLQYYLADSNILNLSERTKVVLGRYKMNGNKVRLLICRYPDLKEAKAAFAMFSKAYFSDRMVEKASVRIEKTEKGEFVSAHAIDKTLILVFGAGEGQTCEGLTEAAEKKIKEIFSQGETSR